MPTLFAPMENVISPSKEKPDRTFLDRPGKAAAVLSWVSGLLAIPGGLYGLAGFFLIIPPVLFVLGADLLVGYIKEARGKARKRSFWIRSIVFNSVLLVATLCLWLANLGELAAEQHLVFLLAISWQAAAIHLSKQAMANPNYCRKRDEKADPAD